MSSLFLFTLSLKKMDTGIAYAVWSGLGITTLTLIGIFRFHEPFTLLKTLFIMMILAGIVGLNLSGST